MKYGYGRVSSTARYAGGVDGDSLESQEKKLVEAGCEEIVLEAYTGTTMDRPKFTKLLSRLVSGDTLVVCKLDRFARTATEGVDLIKELLARGVSVHVLNMGLVEDTPIGRLTLTIMMAFAEYERDVIMERMNEGKALAKAKDPNFRVGRKSMSVPDEFYIVLKQVEDGEGTVVDACKELGISRSLWYKWKNESA